MKLFYFILALFVGILTMYIFAPEPHIIIKYPTLENAGKVIYKDGNDVCYRYKKMEIK